MSEESELSERVAYLLSPRAIRDRANQLFELCVRGDGHFEIHPERLDEVVDLVLTVTRENYPSLEIPFHSRWGHFILARIDRAQPIRDALAERSPYEQARTLLDLVVISVLLDAGAGPNWSYLDRESGQKVGRSEGLALASLDMFSAGYFSTDPTWPYRVDAEALLSLDEARLISGFQVSSQNPLVGLSGRLSLLRNLGQTLKEDPSFFRDQRPGNLLDYLIGRHGEGWSASQLLSGVLRAFGSIWPGRLELDGVPLGDVWRHPGLDSTDEITNMVPFHKLSQWLTYSMIEPIRDAGIVVNGVEDLTGLAEYRNGGLLLDAGLISLRDEMALTSTFSPNAPQIIEWRALTIVFLDRIAANLRSRLNLSQNAFPLAKVLEGGTWHAGRQLAYARRPDGSPPLRLASDGTVF